MWKCQRDSCKSSLEVRGTHQAGVTDLGGARHIGGSGSHELGRDFSLGECGARQKDGRGPRPAYAKWKRLRCKEKQGEMSKEAEVKPGALDVIQAEGKHVLKREWSRVKCCRVTA